MNQRGFVIPSPSMIMAGAIVALSISNVIFFKLWQAKVEEYASYVSKIEAAQERIAAENAAKLRDAEAATKDVSNRWADTVRGIDAAYNSRLLQTKRDCARAASNAATARLVDGSPQEPAASPGSFEAICLQTERDAAHDAGQVIWLQEYVGRVCK